MNIATTLRYVDLKQGGYWDHRYYIMHDYKLMAEKYRIGMTAIMSEHGIDELCRHCDGLFIPGSATDIPAHYYGGDPSLPEPEVDEYYLDALLIKYFFEAGKPIFGICGGEQALNVFFGGTIAKMPDPEHHYDRETCTHPINIVGGSFVHDVFRTERYTVNSHHSWWTDRMAPDLKVVARADDGIVEAFEWKEKNIYATQWHPEQSLHTGSPLEHLFFENFLKRCEECR